MVLTVSSQVFQGAPSWKLMVRTRDPLWQPLKVVPALGYT